MENQSTANGTAVIVSSTMLRAALGLRYAVRTAAQARDGRTPTAWADVLACVGLKRESAETRAPQPLDRTHVMALSLSNILALAGVNARFRTAQALLDRKSTRLNSSHIPLSRM